MNLTIKNVPDHVYKALKQEAARRKRSLNAETILALSAKAEELERRRQIGSSWDEVEKFVASLPRLASSVTLIREDRKRH